MNKLSNKALTIHEWWRRTSGEEKENRVIAINQLIILLWITKSEIFSHLLNDRKMEQYFEEKEKWS